MPWNSFQFACSPKCAIRYAKTKEYFEAIAGDSSKKKVETVSQQHALTQLVFNKWVRVVKDKDETCCISCKRPRGGFTEHCGHFKTVSAAGSIRYHPDCGNLQCYRCNVELSGNVVEYRKNLIEKIGIERVEWLESEAGKPRKYTIAELKDLRARLSKEIREVENE